MSARNGVCSVCSRILPLKDDGNVIRHGVLGDLGGCEGSARPPADYNVNREPALQCPHDLPDDPDHFDCSDPAHRIAAMYQTHDTVNVEIYNDDVEVTEVHAGLSEPAALELMRNWIGHQRHDAEVTQ